MRKIGTVIIAWIAVTLVILLWDQAWQWGAWVQVLTWEHDFTPSPFGLINEDSAIVAWLLSL